MPKRRASDEVDTLIIGAGAAGLGAAAELASRDLPVTVLEARDRIGGRILTGRDSLTPIPVELGAEFIHGRSESVMRWLAACNQCAVDAPQARWTLSKNKLQPGDTLFDEMRSRLDKLAVRQDMPFAQFLQRHSRSLPPAIREFARTLVEGFDAADAKRVSTIEVLKEWSGSAAADSETFRPLTGYDTLMNAIQHSFKPDRVHVRLGVCVRQISWKRDSIDIDAVQHGRPIRVHARRAIVTLPLGVLQLPASSPHAVRFDPPLRQKQNALSLLAAGPVIKMILRFSRPFWDELGECKYKDAAFFHAPDAAFPTFWTSLPIRTSVLVAWSAGPNADRLSGARREDLLEHVFETLRRLFGRRVNYRALLEGFAYHDWQRDPFACGAYSYVLANGRSARATLARPLENTLFFAGEACDTQGEAASVGGALASGQRAASLAIESLSTSEG
ncbi:MAG: flavin monoamine oxidase family protein [Povalibacter sp.]